MAHWIKTPNRAKSQKFKCSKCRRICTCIKYAGNKTMCDYEYCPYCREKMEVEDKAQRKEETLFHEIVHGIFVHLGCVKGGMGYWNKIREDFPDVFQARAKLEIEIGRSCIREVFLDELDPEAGRMSKPILEDCSILCQITVNEMEEEE